MVHTHRAWSAKMGDSDSNVRQRKRTNKEGPERETKTAECKIDDDEAYSPCVDILRVCTFLLVASCGLSYLISSGESFFWGMQSPPKYMFLDWWKSQWNGPAYLTPAQLAAYDGTDPNRPIYVAINGTIYDVTANRRVYGPGGSYHFFSGVDASRGFVTGCFREDRTGDMRGVADMFLPVDDPEVDGRFSADELAQMREAEKRAAEKAVHDALKHWVDFFAKSVKYRFVGYVTYPPGWPETESRRELCAQAMQGRKKRSLPNEA